MCGAKISVTNGLKLGFLKGGLYLEVLQNMYES